MPKMTIRNTRGLKREETAEDINTEIKSTIHEKKSTQTTKDARRRKQIIETYTRLCNTTEKMSEGRKEKEEDKVQKTEKIGHRTEKKVHTEHKEGRGDSDS